MTTVKQYFDRWDLQEKIDLYLKKEQVVSCFVIELYGRKVVNDFIDFIDHQRGGSEWDLVEVTEQDGRDYLEFLEEEIQKKSKKYVKKSYRPGLDEKWSPGMKSGILNSFMNYALSQGWVHRNPFKEIWKEALEQGQAL
ncbi:MAG: hypothetical protein GY754_18795 [bacterium]|nr:hypothetical protein [bacterium]MCP4133021.1 hypothetical protein [bacterium]